ncbi:uncharacterized protein RSE6_07577 [Rhynchosporium secalis]|uniref:Secreted protein n=1 Tax=Rhynchosporium secalis TaxID=38038 RepID=A0A1E1MD70_RHYSE|nr:uncharacterized protein RSE6_07577 [Rhynchosporium secalis]
MSFLLPRCWITWVVRIVGLLVDGYRPLAREPGCWVRSFRITSYETTAAPVHDSLVTVLAQAYDFLAHVCFGIEYQTLEISEVLYAVV